MKAITDTMEVSRSNQYEKMAQPGRRLFYKKAADDHYLKLIREITDERPTYGYRRVAAILNRGLRQKGETPVNHKRVTG